MAKQLPGPKGASVIRVQMDEAELHRLLDPILVEVNALRARVTSLENSLERTVDALGSAVLVIEVLAADLASRQDDGK